MTLKKHWPVVFALLAVIVSIILAAFAYRSTDAGYAIFTLVITFMFLFPLAGAMSGAWYGISFTVSDDGRVKASSPTDEFAGDPPAVPLTDSMGRYYADNAFLLYPLLDETADVQTALEHNGKDVTVFAGLDGGEYCTFTVDRKTLHIREYYESWDDRTVRVTLADDAYMPPTRAGAALMDAGQARTLTYHTYLSGYEKDYVFEIPADWEFSLEVYGDIRFFDDAGQTKEVENLIPADGKDREIWVSDAKG